MIVSTKRFYIKERRHEVLNYVVLTSIDVYHTNTVTSILFTIRLSISVYIYMYTFQSA